MIFEIHEEVPSVEIIPCEKCLKPGILSAYKDYKKLIYGVPAVVHMLDNIAEGTYNRSEAIVAGLLLGKGVSGAILEWRCKGIFLRVNGVDLLAFEDQILDNGDFTMNRFSRTQAGNTF